MAKCKASVRLRAFACGTRVADVILTLSNQIVASNLRLFGFFVDKGSRCNLVISLQHQVIIGGLPDIPVVVKHTHKFWITPSLDIPLLSIRDALGQ